MEGILKNKAGLLGRFAKKLFTKETIQFPVTEKKKGTSILHSKEDDLPQGAISQQIWVDGQPYTLFANSPLELNQKIEKFRTKSAKNLKKESNKDDTGLLLQNFYTEEQEPEYNEWFEKRDVWIYEYLPS